jgi:hypothetical protein
VKALLASPTKLFLLAVFVVTLIAGLFWQDAMFASAVAGSERRPELLRDADWGIPVSSFRERFSAGTSEAELLRWLSENGFKLDGASTSSRTIGGIPCAESVEVTWTAVDGTIRESRAVVQEAGCL